MKHFDIPTLIIHGSDDQIVPIQASALHTNFLILHSELLIYSRAPHGLTDMHKQRVNADMLAFARN